MAEQLFASFILDRDQGLEIAIAAESVTEATSLTENIQPLPASVPFLEGIMHLRDAVIPVLNLKKRMGLEGSKEYDKDAKIAVVLLANQKFGLLFDDIKEVLRVDDSLLLPIQPALQSEDYIISDLITLHKQHRTLEVLDLKRLFKDSSLLTDQAVASTPASQTAEQRTYSRYVIFSSGDREYGVPVENSRELTFITEIDDMFKTGYLEGALQLRGRTIPVMNASALLNGGSSVEAGELSRILVMTTDALSFGMIIDEIVEILTVCNEEILHMPSSKDQSVAGIYEPVPGRNIMLLDVANLVTSQMEILESMSRIKTDDEGNDVESAAVAESRHLITENCYLIFSIEKNFAIELKDVQEIIEHDMLMAIPGAQGFDSRVLNLRGQVIPVVDLRSFYNYPEHDTKSNSSRLIICRDGKHVVALQVDNIVTIFKQEEFHPTPSLNPQLQPKKDTLDRLIEFVGEQGIVEHVLVINTHNLINNHLRQDNAKTEPSVEYHTTEETAPLTDTLKGGE
jgi:purine-binding chemotaxis protein CheW